MFLDHGKPKYLVTAHVCMGKTCKLYGEKSQTRTFLLLGKANEWGKTQALPQMKAPSLHPSPAPPYHHSWSRDRLPFHKAHQGVLRHLSELSIWLVKEPMWQKSMDITSVTPLTHQVRYLQAVLMCWSCVGMIYCFCDQPATEFDAQTRLKNNFQRQE